MTDYSTFISAVSKTDPSYEASPDYDARRYEKIAITWADPSLSNPGFTNQECRFLETIVKAGRYAYGDHNQNKLSVIGRNEYFQKIGVCQGFAENIAIDSYAMGDSAIGQHAHYFAGGPCNGDEGQAIRLVGRLSQQGNLVLTTVASIPSQPAQSNSTQLNGAITAARTAQTFDVDDASWISVNDWICIEPGVPDAANQLEAVKVTAKTSNTLTAKVLYNHPDNSVVKPCKLLALDGVYQMGELRVLINRTGASYSTGTVNAVSGGGVEFSGTSLAENIVGGDAQNIGAISFDQDEYIGPPFDGSGSAGPLRSWYQIGIITSATHLSAFKTSVASDASLNTFATNGGGFKIVPAMRILKIVGNTVVCEPSAHTWDVGDTVECIICPYADVSGIGYNVAVYTKGFADDRAFYYVRNFGPRQLGIGYSVGRYGAAPAGADAYGWRAGFAADWCETGLNLGGACGLAIQLPGLENVTDGCGTIRWHEGTEARRIEPDQVNQVLRLKMGGDTGAWLEAFSTAQLTESLPQLAWGGSVKFGAYIDIPEMTEPAAPAANRGRLFMKDVGGKTALLVRFPSGASQQIAIEP